MKRKIIVISLLVIIASLSIATVSNAAIQIKPTQANIHTNITASNAYQYCYDMRNASSSLGVNNLDPHLTLNKDWGAAAYLAISAYGTTRSAYPTSVSIDGYGYRSTTGNVTGVMNMHKRIYTASVVENATDLTNLTNIVNNKNTKYVEIIPKSNLAAATKGYAFEETRGWYGSNGVNPSGYSTIERNNGILTTQAGTGISMNDISFRPVIWNK